MDVNITLHDGAKGSCVDTTGFHDQEGRLEEHLGEGALHVAKGDDLPELIPLPQEGVVGHTGHLLFKVQGLYHSFSFVSHMISCLVVVVKL